MYSFPVVIYSFCFFLVCCFFLILISLVFLFWYLIMQRIFDFRGYRRFLVSECEINLLFPLKYKYKSVNTYYTKVPILISRSFKSYFIHHIIMYQIYHKNSKGTRIYSVYRMYCKMRSFLAERRPAHSPAVTACRVDWTAYTVVIISLIWKKSIIICNRYILF